MEQRNYYSNNSNSTDQSLNNSNQITTYAPYKVNDIFYNQNHKLAKNIESPKVIQNKINTQTDSNYSIYNQNKKILKNNSKSRSMNNSKQNINSFDSSFYSQKPIQTFELNINSYNNVINTNNNMNKINKINNIVNIDNKGSAIQLCFLATKKPKNKYKSTIIYQVGLEQTPLSFTYLAEKPNKLSENNKNIELNININNNGINNNNINNSFINNNSSFIENDNNLSISNSRKNELKIMQNPERKNNINIKPKPILQIMSNNSNKSNFSKKLSENNLLQVNGFSLEGSNNINNDMKNNFTYISKSASMIVGNNNNQDMSFISNSKETENLFDINNAIDNKNNIYSMSNGLSFSQQIENSNVSNVYSGYIMINKQLCFLAEKKIINNKDEITNINNISNISKTSAKKYIKFEYYDTQPVYFDIISEKNNNENNHGSKCYKIYRVEDLEFVVINNNKIKDNKEDNKSTNDNEDKSMEKEENKSFNNVTNNKKRRRRKKKK